MSVGNLNEPPVTFVLLPLSRTRSVLLDNVPVPVPLSTKFSVLIVLAVIVSILNASALSVTKLPSLNLRATVPIAPLSLKRGKKSPLVCISVVSILLLAVI